MPPPTDPTAPSIGLAFPLTTFRVSPVAVALTLVVAFPRKMEMTMFSSAEMLWREDRVRVNLPMQLTEAKGYENAGISTDTTARLVHRFQHQPPVSSNLTTGFNDIGRPIGLCVDDDVGFATW